MFVSRFSYFSSKRGWNVMFVRRFVLPLAVEPTAPQWNLSAEANILSVFQNCNTIPIQAHLDEFKRVM